MMTKAHLGNSERRAHSGLTLRGENCWAWRKPKGSLKKNNSPSSTLNFPAFTTFKPWSLWEPTGMTAVSLFNIQILKCCLLFDFSSNPKWLYKKSWPKPRIESRQKLTCCNLYRALSLWKPLIWTLVSRKLL